VFDLLVSETKEPEKQQQHKLSLKIGYDPNFWLLQVQQHKLSLKIGYDPNFWLLHDLN
jgi:hypothetical protein